MKRNSKKTPKNIKAMQTQIKKHKKKSAANQKLQANILTKRVIVNKSKRPQNKNEATTNFKNTKTNN